MNVTVVVSGLPDKVSLKELACNFDKLFNTDDVGTFRLRDLSNENESRLVALDFENGFSAMTVQLMLDGFQYKLPNGEEYKLKCKISKNKKHLQLAPITYEHNDYTCVSKYDYYSNSVVTFNEDMIERQNSNLDAQLKLLKKKKMLVEAERELVKAKRKLKKEYCKVASDSEDENSSGSHKHTKMPKSSKSRKRKSKSRDRHSSSTYSPPSKYSYTSTKSRHKSKSLSRSSSRSRKSPSLTRSTRTHVSRRLRSPRKTSKLYDDCSIYPSASNRSPSQSRRLSNKETSLVLYEPRKSSCSLYEKSYAYKTSPSFKRSPSSSRRLSHKEKSSSFRRSRSRESPYYRNRSWTRRTSPSYYRSSRYSRIHGSPLDVKDYKDDTYSRRKYDNYDENKIQSTSQTTSNSIKCAIRKVIIEIDNLVQRELKTLSLNDINIVTNVFKDYVKNGIRQLNNVVNEDMAVSEILNEYRCYRSTEEDKSFFLKLINELKPIDMKKTIENNDNISIRQSDVWDDIDEVLQEIPTEILQDNNDTSVSNNNDSGILITNTTEQSDVIRIHIDLKIHPESKCSEAASNDTDGHKSKIYTSDWFNKYTSTNGNINVQDEKPEEVEDKLSSEIIIISDEEKIVPKKENIEQLQQILDNILQDFIEEKSRLENKALENTENDKQVIAKPDTVVPKRPQFIIPVKKLMIQMKTLLKLNSECKYLHNITQIVLRERLRILLMEKEQMKSAQIVALYRSHYPKEDDEIFLKCIIEVVNSGKYHELCEKQ
ncbi:unnamed protein product [Diatraea saccharalis]|uniref:Uncharacterized protein n=1 Tax=Diatraea saccharalis TaxID=40085 RepID=A0A9N9WEU5_9NEOP|nr:unnamed protein product [Diatraea saccharalis]